MVTRTALLRRSIQVSEAMTAAIDVQFERGGNRRLHLQDIHEGLDDSQVELLAEIVALRKEWGDAYVVPRGQL